MLVVYLKLRREAFLSPLCFCLSQIEFLSGRDGVSFDSIPQSQRYIFREDEWHLLPYRPPLWESKKYGQWIGRLQFFDSHESGIFLSDFIKNKSFLHPAFPLGVPGYGKDLMACFPDYRESPFWGKKKSDDINEAWKRPVLSVVLRQTGKSSLLLLISHHRYG